MSLFFSICYWFYFLNVWLFCCEILRFFCLLYFHYCLIIVTLSFVRFPFLCKITVEANWLCVLQFLWPENLWTSVANDSLHVGLRDKKCLLVLFDLNPHHQHFTWFASNQKPLKCCLFCMACASHPHVCHVSISFAGRPVGCIIICNDWAGGSKNASSGELRMLFVSEEESAGVHRCPGFLWPLPAADDYVSKSHSGRVEKGVSKKHDVHYITLSCPWAFSHSHLLPYFPSL